MAFRVHAPARNRTVGDCAHLCWEVHFACDAGHAGRIGSQELLARFPAEATLDAIAERLVCRTCGLRTGALDLRQDGAATSARDLARFGGEDKYR